MVFKLYYMHTKLISFLSKLYSIPPHLISIRVNDSLLKDIFPPKLLMNWHVHSSIDNFSHIWLSFLPVYVLKSLHYLSTGQIQWPSNCCLWSTCFHSCPFSKKALPELHSLESIYYVSMSLL